MFMCKEKKEKWFSKSSHQKDNLFSTTKKKEYLHASCASIKWHGNESFKLRIMTIHLLLKEKKNNSLKMNINLEGV